MIPRGEVNGERARSLYRPRWYIAEVPLAEELTIHAHDFDALFRESGAGAPDALRLHRRSARRGGGGDGGGVRRALARSGTIRIRWRIYRTAFRLANEELRVERRRGARTPEVESPPPELGVIDALRQLSPNQRAASCSGHVLDLDVSEVARRMGIVPPTVRAPASRRKRLRDCCEEEVGDA